MGDLFPKKAPYPPSPYPAEGRYDRHSSLSPVRKPVLDMKSELIMETLNSNTCTLKAKPQTVKP